MIGCGYQYRHFAVFVKYFFMFSGAQEIPRPPKALGREGHDAL
jgi:hypothetical protein